MNLVFILILKTTIKVHLHYIFIHLYTYSRNTRGVRKGNIVTDEERDGQSDPYFVILCVSRGGGGAQKDKTNNW